MPYERWRALASLDGPARALREAEGVHKMIGSWFRSCRLHVTVSQGAGSSIGRAADS